MTSATATDGNLGHRRISRRVFLIFLVILPLVGAINASSLWSEARRSGLQLHPSEPWILELTSISTIIFLVPLITWLERRFPLHRGVPLRAVGALALGCVVFSLLHVAGMTLQRTVLMPIIMGESHRLPAGLSDVLLYELRKDVFPYLIVLIIAGLIRRIELGLKGDVASRDGPDPAGGKLTLRSGHCIMMIDPATVEWARAAGNYVELKSAGRAFLPRITLVALEEKLRAAGVDMVRVHRSTIVNRLAIAEIRPLSGGDFLVQLHNGVEVRGSRRYRERVSADVVPSRRHAVV